MLRSLARAPVAGRAAARLSGSVLLQPAAGSHAAHQHHMHGQRRTASSTASPAAGADLLSEHDAAQVAMLEEMCIIVDMDDRVIGEDTKKNVHLRDGPCMRAGGTPHRAFSAFVFNSKGELLMQQRSEEKILFPLNWANSCCSHPLAEGALFLGETVTGEADGAAGTIKAARRKLEQELGIDPEALPADCFQFVTKVHYKAPCDDPVWGEHEIDYCLVARPPADIVVRPNANEVYDARWFSQDEMRQFIRSARDPDGPIISPWFSVIEQALLHGWWDDLSGIEPDGAIHRF
eukprot:SAG22_NODE_2087_length_3031_cov_1.440655_2_plen_291_part_00